ncbi:MGST3 [Symbiodinium pilosum]|uniref:MGST3 protein n=1 Tax=Symbiodinium pilosum TaxID=2952 RepID=A0A812T4K5_SYMPI|nr:MGST3 [Symbiodinium pilosum]
MAFSFPDDYGYVVLAHCMSWISNMYLTINVVKARKQYGIKYPALYAPDGHPNAESFNSVQRAHQNTLENWAPVQILMAFNGILYPKFAASCGMIWAFGRIVYGYGYAKGGPDGRMANARFALHPLAYLWLQKLHCARATVQDVGQYGDVANSWHCKQEYRLPDAYQRLPGRDFDFGEGLSVDREDTHGRLPKSTATACSVFQRRPVCKTSRKPIFGAKQAHPDVMGCGSNDMVQLNLCYEALTQKRREYDAAKGTGQKTSSNSSSASSSTWNTREAWWRAQGGFEDQDEDYHPFHFQDFAERKWRPKRENGRRRPSWEDFAQMWDEGEFDARDRGPRKKRGRRAARRVQDWSSDDEEEMDWRQRPPGHGSQARGSHWQDSSSSEDEQEEEPRGPKSGRQEDIPTELWIGVPQRGRNMRWENVGGGYQRLEALFNGRPAFKKSGEYNVFIFWSQQFGDWKIAERLQDDGACLGFAEDMRGRRRPWLQHPPLRWRLWEPTARRYVPKRLTVLDGPDISGKDWKTTHDSQDKDDLDDEVPWSRPHWSQWSTTDLIRWCERRNIDLSGCFDREAVVERVMALARQEMARDDDDYERRDRVSQVRVASRVKTDGSYTKPPTLDRRNSLYGNRIERFFGPEADVLPWLYSAGDKSRLYGVFFGNEFAYSLVWKRQKFWGRPGTRTSREERW